MATETLFLPTLAPFQSITYETSILRTLRICSVLRMLRLRFQRWRPFFLLPSPFFLFFEAKHEEEQEDIFFLANFPSFPSSLGKDF